MAEAEIRTQRSPGSTCAAQGKYFYRSHFKFIEHNQPEEFIEVFKMHKKANGGNIDDMLEEFGKTYLHLAVEHQSRRIVEFLMFE